MRLTPRVSLIGSGEPGLATTDPLDSQVYLIRTSTSISCVDSGTGNSVDAILAAAKDEGTSPEAIDWLYLTHAHADHAGGAAAWQERLPGIRVAMAADAADWIREADEEATSLAPARRAGLYPPDYRLRPARIDRELVDGEQIELGDGVLLTVVSTPGHSRGHLAFLVEDPAPEGARTLLFSGDALFPGGKILLVDTWDCELEASLRSVERLVDLQPDQLFAGHLAPQLEDVADTLTAARERLTRLLPPLNLV